MIHDTYRWSAGARGGQETMLRMGAGEGPTVLILPPLFEEANRMRFVLAGVMRALEEAARDDGFSFATVQPDLPGTGESTVATVDARFDDWAAAVAAVAATLPRPVLTLAVRGGALLDQYAGADARWRLAPESGARLLRDMLRATALSSSEKVGDIEHRARSTPTLLAGNMIHPDLYASLDDALPDVGANVRTASLDDQTAHDVKIDGTLIWRRVEPGSDPRLVRGIADDVFGWMKQCAGR